MCQHAQSPSNTHSNTPNPLSASPTIIPDCIPSDLLCQSAYTFAAKHLHPSILAHSLRVFLHARHILALPSTVSGVHWEIDKAHAETMTFIAAMFHDMGTTAACNGPERFEVEGADAAATFLTGRLDEKDIHAVWTAVALHTSSGIAERIAPLARLIRVAVLVDFDRPGLRTELQAVELSRSLEATYPREEIEKVLGDAVVAQIRSKPEGKERLWKAPANSWPGNLWRGEMEGAYDEDGVNLYF